MANPFPFVAGNVLTAAGLNGIGEASVSFTATITNYTRGNGTSTARYIRVNKLVYVFGQEVLGSTSSITGELQPNFPVTAAFALSLSHGVCNMNDTGTAAYTGIVYPVDTSKCALRSIVASGPYAQQSTTSSTVPFTWTTGDNFEYSYVYEAA